MNNIYVLDCTLRDGGYCNEWKFGYKNIKKIAASLVEANVDIVEVGFLTNKSAYDVEVSKFTSVDEIKAILPLNRSNKLFVAMINYGEFNIEKLPICDGNSIDGIRVAFHKKDMDQALEVCEIIKRKGYKVFIQPMVSLSYTDEEFLSLILKANQIVPYAFYIVDSFGMMKRKNLLRLFYMVEHNLDATILIGFHSHNNMQLAFSNAQCLIDTQTTRSIIIDASIYGMGRGAGNLNTELLVEYLNENIRSAYRLKPLLNVIDEILNVFFQKNNWGYSLPNYLSAFHNIHPNYAGYLVEKNTLTVEAIDEIFSAMNSSKKYEFDKDYIEELYTKYMECGKSQDEHNMEIKELLKGKKVLLIAPGKSSVEEVETIQSYAKQEDVISMGVNFEYSELQTDFIFISNMRRFKLIDKSKYNKCIVTSNIATDTAYLKTSYYNLLNGIEAIKDNAGMMAIQFLISVGVENIYLAGFDGYGYDSSENYASLELAYVTEKTMVDAMNDGMNKMLQTYREQVSIEIITTPRNIR